MAVIQFSVPTSTLVRWAQRGEELGLSEHQVAKMLAILGDAAFTNSDIIDEYIRQRGTTLGRKAQGNVRPITSREAR